MELVEFEAVEFDQGPKLVAFDEVAVASGLGEEGDAARPEHSPTLRDARVAVGNLAQHEHDHHGIERAGPQREARGVSLDESDVVVVHDSVARVHEHRMLQVGEYRAGSDELADQAIERWPALQTFLRQRPDEAMALPQTLTRLAEVVS